MRSRTGAATEAAAGAGAARDGGDDLTLGAGDLDDCDYYLDDDDDCCCCCCCCCCCYLNYGYYCVDCYQSSDSGRAIGFVAIVLIVAIGWLTGPRRPLKPLRISSSSKVADYLRPPF